MKNSLKNTFSVDGKIVFTARNVWQMKKKRELFLLARKAVFTRSKEVFL